MGKNINISCSQEQNEILQYLFQGYSISQIAKKKHCSISTISYQLSILYAKYNVNSKSEFIIKIYNEIIENYKNTINAKDTRLLFLQHKLDLTKNVLSSLLQNQNNPGIFEYWINEAKRHLKNS